MRGDAIDIRRRIKDNHGYNLVLVVKRPHDFDNDKKIKLLENYSF